MFGYVKVYKPDLKVAEYDTYKAVYCSLCKNLGKNYGPMLRMTLSYDFTFLAMLMLSLENDNCSFKKSHCVYNPFKKCYYTCGKESVLDFVSAVAAMMIYFKVLDNVRDEKGLKKLANLLLSKYLRRKANKARANYPNIFEIVSNYNQMQIKAETADNACLDSLAEPTATVLSSICASLSEDVEQKAHLSRLGYCLGRWIYLIDDANDFEEDAKQGKANTVLLSSFDTVISNLYFSANEAGQAFDSLNTNRFSGIIKNILYIGMPAQVDNITNSRKEEQNGKQSV